MFATATKRYSTHAISDKIKIKTTKITSNSKTILGFSSFLTFLFLKSHAKSNFPVRITKTIWNFFTNMFSISLHSFKNIYIFYYKILYFLKLQKHLQFSLIIINYIYNSKLKIWSCKRDSLVKLH